MAWLHVVPESPDKKRPETKTRFEALDAQGLPAKLPDNPAPHITDWLLEIGPVANDGAGSAPLGWQDLLAWQSLTGIDLDPWEARTLRQLSQSFLTQRLEARKHDCPAPYLGEAEDIVTNRDRVAAQVRNILGGRK